MVNPRLKFFSYLLSTTYEHPSQGQNCVSRTVYLEALFAFKKGRQITR